MSLFDLTGRVAIVTGGNGGIGLGMAEGLAAAGATVVLAGRNAKKAEAAVKGIADAGGKAEFAEVDVTSEESCRALIDGIARRHGKLNIPDVFAGLLTIILIGLAVENVIFRLVEQATVRRWGMQD